jgi:hypothetical protein
MNPMLARMALKEVRETIWIAAAALAIYLFFVLRATGFGPLAGTAGGRDALAPFIDEETVVGLAVVAMCLPAGLGLWQTVGESARGTFQFLLHRPAGPARLIGTKLLVGSGLCLVVSGVPVLLYAWWAATPGNHPCPFEWRMTAIAWKAWIANPTVYLGAFLAGIRPGRWHGTRLLPLPTAGLAALLIPVFPCWLATGLPTLMILNLLLVTDILFVARSRDFS